MVSLPELCPHTAPRPSASAETRTSLSRGSRCAWLPGPVCVLWEEPTPASCGSCHGVVLGPGMLGSWPSGCPCWGAKTREAGPGLWVPRPVSPGPGCSPGPRTPSPGCLPRLRSYRLKTFYKTTAPALPAWIRGGEPICSSLSRGRGGNELNTVPKALTAVQLRESFSPAGPVSP